MNTHRTDTHSPKNIDPADYLAVGSFDDHAEDGYGYMDTDLIAQVQGSEIPDTTYADTGHTGSTCQHCGQHIRYGVVFIHKPTGELLNVGETCATKLDLPSRDAIADRQQAQARKLAKVRGQRLAGDPAARRAADFMTDSLVQLSELYGETWVDEDELNSMSDEQTVRRVRAEIDRKRAEVGLNGWGENFLSDVNRRWERDAKLSDKQVAVILRLQGEAEETRAIMAERAAERAAAEPCPEGRIEISGEVVKTDWQDNDFGGRAVMTVKDARGFLVWGSIPSSIDPERGDPVTFTATVTPSPDDDKFGFYKRPTKAEVTEKEES